MPRQERGLYQVGKIWYYHIEVNKHKERKSTGFEDIKKARDVRAKKLVDLREGRFFDIAKDNVTTYDEACKSFMKYSETNKRSYSRDLDFVKHFKPFLSGKRLSEITPSLLEEYKRQRLNKNKSKQTINHELSFLRAVINYAIRDKQATKNPVNDVRFFKIDPEAQEDRVITEDEAARFLDNCFPYFQNLVLAALLTSCRLGELLSLKWADVNFESRTLHIRFAKSGKGRKIYISDKLKEVIERCKKHTDGKYVFCNHKKKTWMKIDTKERKEYADIRSIYERAIAKAGVEPFTFHDFRHCGASLLSRESKDNREVLKNVLGHSDMRLSNRYAHSFPLDVEYAMQEVGKRIDELDKHKNSIAPKVIEGKNNAKIVEN